MWVQAFRSAARALSLSLSLAAWQTAMLCWSDPGGRAVWRTRPPAPADLACSLADLDPRRHEQISCRVVPPRSAHRCCWYLFFACVGGSVRGPMLNCARCALRGCPCRHASPAELFDFAVRPGLHNQMSKCKVQQQWATRPTRRTRHVLKPVLCFLTSPLRSEPLGSKGSEDEARRQLIVSPADHS